jgi:hypothetical protein
MFDYTSTLTTAVVMCCFRSFSDWLVPQLQEDSANFIFIQDGALPHWHMEVEIIWIKICLDVGFATQQTRT